MLAFFRYSRNWNVGVKKKLFAKLYNNEITSPSVSMIKSREINGAHQAPLAFVWFSAVCS